MSSTYKVSDWAYNDESPLVSVCVLTYNHEDYLKTAIDSILMQQVDFQIEILVHDDASADSTQEILREYDNKYPGLFKLLLRKENIRSKTGGGINPRYNYTRSKGKYIALLEGDDYWTDPNKLKRQVDFLQANPDYFLCFHDCRYLHDNGLGAFFLDNYHYKEDCEISPKEFLQWLAQTATIVHRNDPGIVDRFNEVKSIMYGDGILRCVFAELGRLYLMKDSMSVYRVHNGGITAKANNSKRDMEKIRQFKEMEGVFNISFSQVISKSYYAVAQRSLISKSYFDFMRYFGLAILKDPSYILGRVNSDLKRKLKGN